ncbi:MAG: NUDIX domain-containing protein [Eubacteriales bacterium]|nr:NUDIX domain-containing protein [Eubacteriales bacterium]
MKRNKNGQTLEEFLAAYQPGDYENPSVTVDMLIFGVNETKDKLKILLIQRQDHPYIDCWAFPGGFINIEESAYTAACRELKEETGLTDVYMEQLYTFSQPDRDPRTRVIDIAYMALLPETTVTAGDDAKDAAWFDVTMTEDVLTIENTEKNVSMRYRLEAKDFKNGVITISNKVPVLESEDALAFDHSEILYEGICRLRNKVRYTDIAFNLLPPTFTMPEVKAVYELILGDHLFLKQINRMTADYVKQIGEQAPNRNGGRPAKLYTHI